MVRGDRPVVLTNSLDGTGVQKLFDTIMATWAASKGQLVA
jgi:urease accessory protein